MTKITKHFKARTDGESATTQGTNAVLQLDPIIFERGRRFSSATFILRDCASTACAVARDDRLLYVLFMLLCDDAKMNAQKSILVTNFQLFTRDIEILDLIIT